jgi:hypothetical protein
LNKRFQDVSRMQSMLRLIIALQEQQIYVGRPSWQFCYFVESRLVPMLQENLLDVVSKRILVHGNLGCGKTSLVEYVIQRYAEDLLNRFSGGIYKLQYGTDDCDNIISQFSINVFAFLEGTTIPNMDCKLVEKPGGRCHARWNYYVLEDCDHVNVCKPSDKKHPSYEMLLTVIKDCREQKVS